MDQKFIPVAFLLLGIALGFAGGRMSTGQSLIGTGDAVVDETLKARLMETGVLTTQPAEVKQLSGTIRAINGDTLTVALSYPRDPLGDPSLDERIVTVNKDTTITVMTQKDQAVYAKELSDYQTKMNTWKPTVDAAPSTMPTPPQLFEKKDGTLTSLKVGATLSISTGEDVKLKKNFAALTIEATPTTTIGGSATPSATALSTGAVPGAVAAPAPTYTAPSTPPTPAPAPVDTSGKVAPAPVTTAGTEGEPSRPDAPK
jgi:hypothetical protein